MSEKEIREYMRMTPEELNREFPHAKNFQEFQKWIDKSTEKLNLIDRSTKHTIFTLETRFTNRQKHDIFDFLKERLGID